MELFIVACDLQRNPQKRARMPRTTRPKNPNHPRRESGNFRQRYDEVEQRRAELMARVANLSQTAGSHPGYRRAQTLLNDTFRKASVAQRGAVLQSAAWLINLLESMVPFA
jgi:hypothetical protein